MTYEFKAGETYRTADGHDAHLLGATRDYLIGYVWRDGFPEPLCWTLHGSEQIVRQRSHYGGRALTPPKREVWVAVWLFADDVRCQAFDSAEEAEKWVQGPDRIRLAVLGPVDREPKP